jgi:hypothetical protein
MNTLRGLTKHHLPRPVVRNLRFLYNKMSTRLRREAVWWLNPAHWRSHLSLGRYRDIHEGERCFVIGNGPSLNKMDLSPLAHEVTFGLNRIYLLFDRLGFGTSYYVAINELVLEQFAADIERLSMPKFVRWEHRRFLHPSSDLMYIRWRPGPSFSHDIRHGAWGGATVTYMALQLAYFMGFQQVVLIGVDHSFKTKGQPHKEVLSTGDDPNHFAPNYFGTGVRWHLPDPETSELAYQLGRQNFEAEGRSILDATVGGKLDVFPKVSYEHIITTPPRQPVSLSEVSCALSNPD